MNITRRKALSLLGTMAGATPLLGLSSRVEALNGFTTGIKGNIKHSVCKWCYGDIPLDEFCNAVRRIGIQSVELVGPDAWPTLQKYGLTCAMPNGAEISLTRGFSNPSYHSKLVENYERMIPLVAEAGYDKIICFSGNRNGMDEETGLKNAAKGLKRIMRTAEDHKVTVVMELLNSKVDHPDYMCDHTAWGVALCKLVGSERFKLLYDIYHMQIMEGDVIRTIRNNHEYIAHYHTGGVPGRNEIDETQELNYPAIIRAIIETGFEGFVAQEFIPTWDDQLAALKQGVEICDV
jgi:hydroxypyruvate isomerase